MKNFEGFRASVYARAEARRIKIRERNRKIRNASLSFAMIALAVVMAVPLFRMTPMVDPNPNTAPDQGIVQQHTVDPARQPAEIPPSRMVLLMGVPGGGAAEVVVLDSSAKQKSFVNKYKEDNHMPVEEDLPLTPAPEAPKTVSSIDELAEFLQELPKTNDSIQWAISDFDENFFANNVLCCVPLDIGLTDDLAPEYDLPATDQPPESETEPVSLPDAGDTDALDADGEEVTLPPPPTQLAEELLQANDVKVLLLVPMNKE